MQLAQKHDISWSALLEGWLKAQLMWWMTSSGLQGSPFATYDVCEVFCDALVADAWPTRKVNNGSQNGKRGSVPRSNQSPEFDDG